MKPLQKSVIAVLLLMAFLPLVSSAWTSDLNTSLEGYWAFDDNTGVIATNQINSSLDGTLNGSATWVTSGKSGSSVNFYSGTSDYVATPYFVPTGNNTKAISLWFNYNYTGSYYFLFSAGDQVNNGEGWGAYGDSLTGNLYTFLQGFDQQISNIMTNNTWHHLVMSYDGTATTAWVDGVNTSTDAQTLITQTTYPLEIGRIWYGNYYDGTIDEVAVWSRALNETDVQELWNSGNGNFLNPPPAPALLPYIDMISPTATTYNVSNILVNISSDGDYVWFNVNGTNQTYTGSFIGTFADGSYILYAWANNTNGENSTSVAFSVNTTVPTPPTPPTTTGLGIYDTMNESGAGLGIFIQLMARALPPLIIILALVGIIVAIAYSLKGVLIKVGTP